MDTIHLSLIALILSFIAGCSDKNNDRVDTQNDSKKSPEKSDKAERGNVKLFEDFPYPCDSAQLDSLIYVKEKGFFVCSDQRSWQPIDLRGPPGAEGPQGSRGVNVTDLNVLDEVPKAKSNVSNIDLLYINAIKFCRDLTESGYDDWRLPSWQEAFYFATEIQTPGTFWTKDFAPWTAGARYPVIIFISSGHVQLLTTENNGEKRFVFCVR